MGRPRLRRDSVDRLVILAFRLEQSRDVDMFTM